MYTVIFVAFVYVHAVKTWRGGGVAPPILNIDSRWGWMVSFMWQGNLSCYPQNEGCMSPAVSLNALKN
jgi:hypothetical protein